MKKRIGLALTGLAGFLVSGVAVAQLQPQGLTVGSPQMAPSMPSYGSPSMPLLPPPRTSPHRSDETSGPKGERAVQPRPRPEPSRPDD